MGNSKSALVILSVLYLSGCTITVAESGRGEISEAKQDFLACEAFVSWGKGPGQTVVNAQNLDDYLAQVSELEASISTYDTALALKVAKFLSEQKTSASLEVKGEVQLGTVSIFGLLDECSEILGID